MLIVFIQDTIFEAKTFNGYLQKIFFRYELYYIIVFQLEIRAFIQNLLIV